MWRVEGEIPGGLLSQVDQEGGMHHGDSKATTTIPLPNRNVGRSTFVITLKRRSGQSHMSHHEEGMGL